MSEQRLLLLAIALLLTACTPSGVEQGSNVTENDEPLFSGPHASQMEEDYRSSESPFFRQVIFDGKVTEAEYREAREKEANCLVEHGFTGVQFNSDGTSSMDVRSDLSDQEQLAVADECSRTTGSDLVSVWYNTLAANPDNVDWPTAERDCLVKAGLLEPGTTVGEMNRWFEQKGKGSDSRAAYVCSEDALGKLGLK